MTDLRETSTGGGTTREAGEPLVRACVEPLDRAGETRDESAPPAWLLMLGFILAAVAVGLGAVGLLLAINGWYRPALAFPLGLLVAAGLVGLAWPVFSRTRAPSTRAHRVAAIGVVAIAAVTLWNGAHASQHVLIDRDGGSYLNTGRWIARDGSLEIHPHVGPFATEPTVGFNSLAVYQMHDGTLQFQFAHFLPTLLAEGYAVGGEGGLFATPALLGGIALLAFFALSWRIIRRPWFALAATLALAFLVPQVSFSRDSYSEIPSQILLFTALWLLVSSKVIPRARLAFVAGVFLGMMQAVRIDAVVFLIGVPAIFAVAWLRAEPGAPRRPLLAAMGAFTLGLVPGVVLGFVDLARHSGQYFHDLWPDQRKLIFLAVLAVVGSAAVVALWRFVVPVARKLPWNTISAIAAVFTAIIGFGTWILRPHLQETHAAAQSFVGGLQRAEHVPIDLTRAYYEQSLSWMSWYLGPLTLAAAIIGAALLVRALLLGRMSYIIAPLFVLVPGSLLYLLKASAVPDQVWVTRRFLVSAFPTLILLALGLAAWLASRRTDRFARAMRVGGIALAVLAVAFPVYTVISVRDMREKAGFVAVVHDVCHALGPHAAVVVVERDNNDLLDDWVPQTLRGFCGADVAVSRGKASTPTSLHRLARGWAAQGRPFFIATNSADEIHALLPGVDVFTSRHVTDTHTLSMTLTHRPRGYRPQSFSMALGEVAPG